MANSVTFGTKRFLDVLLGNRAVKQLWWGSHLIWERIGKLLALDDSDKMICIEYVPTVDTNVSSLSVFIENGTSYGWTCILNECGLCVAVKNESGTSSETIYGLSANLVTVSSLGSPKLLAGRKYYIGFKISQWDSNNTQFAYYQGKSGNYKIYNTANESVFSAIDLQTIPCIGSIYHLGTFDSSTGIFTPSTYYGSECDAQTLFIWRGGYVSSSTFFGNNLAMYNKRDMRKFRGMITDQMLNDCQRSMRRLAFIYYVIGNTEGNEIAWGAQNNYSSGITVNGVAMFDGGLWSIYKGTGNITKNHITSMTPITAEPDHSGLVLGDIYYKGETSSGWLDSNGNPITSEMVVAWKGNYWEFASDWMLEFNKESDTLETAVETENGYATQSFNGAEVYTDKKYYLRINGNEV